MGCRLRSEGRDALKFTAATVKSQHRPWIPTAVRHWQHTALGWTLQTQNMWLVS